MTNGNPILHDAPQRLNGVTNEKPPRKPFVSGFVRRSNKCGEGGIRTPGTVAGTQHFQCCTIGHSVTSPGALSDGPPDAADLFPVAELAVKLPKTDCISENLLRLTQQSQRLFAMHTRLRGRGPLRRR